jgi:hypothetical protein
MNATERQSKVVVGEPAVLAHDICIEIGGLKRLGFFDADF